MKSIKELLIKALQPPLPGDAAQMLMAPKFRGEKNFFADDNPIPGSVLILFYPTPKGICIPFIQRPEYEGAHSGQISFPGGKYEKEDASYWETAIRETHEELGIETDKIEKIGLLTSLYIPVSNYIVTPHVGFLEKMPSFNPNPDEVSEIIEVPVNHFFSPANIKHFNGKRNGIQYDFPYYDVAGKSIWGATAMILSELMEIIKVLFEPPLPTPTPSVKYPQV